MITSLKFVLLAAFLLLVVLVSACASLITKRKRARTAIAHIANIAEGSHKGRTTRATDAAITTRFLLGKIGSDANHIAVSGSSDIPIGVITDESVAAEDLVNVNLLGCNAETQRMVASGVINAGDFIVPDASGKVKTLPGTTGTYYIVGRALTAAAADLDVIEVDPIPCVQRVV